MPSWPSFECEGQRPPGIVVAPVGHSGFRCTCDTSIATRCARVLLRSFSRTADRNWNGGGPPHTHRRCRWCIRRFALTSPPRRCLFLTPVCICCVCAFLPAWTHEVWSRPCLQRSRSRRAQSAAAMDRAPPPPMHDAFKGSRTCDLIGHSKKARACASMTLQCCRTQRTCNSRVCLHTQVHSVAWNCTGRKLASGSVDRTARIWDIHHVRRSVAALTLLARRALA